MGIPLGSRVEEFVKNRDNPRHFRKDYCSPLFLRPRRRNAQRVFLGFAFALLSLAIPTAAAQPFASRDLDKEFETSGYGLPNKNPSGVWMDEDRRVLLVLDHKSKRIYSYSVNPGPENPERLTLTRLDNHHNDGKTNVDDFILPDVYDVYELNNEEKRIKLIPYGIWANGKTNGATLWVSYYSNDTKSGNWRLLPEDEFKATRESNVDGQDRLTIILPKAAGKQRFLRLMPQR